MLRQYMQIVSVCLGVIFLMCTQKSPLDTNRLLHENSPRINQISATPGKIGIGGAMSVIRVQLMDEEGLPYKGQTVRFSTTLGIVSSKGTTDSTGWAQAILKSGDTEGIATVTVLYQDVAKTTVAVEFQTNPEISLIMWIQNRELYANGIDTTWIWVELGGDSATYEQGQTLQLTSTAGQLGNNGNLILNSSGTGFIYFVSDPRVRDTMAVIRSTYKSYSAIDTIKMKGIDFQLFASPGAILADGKSTSYVQAILKENSTKLAIANRTILFSTEQGLIPRTAFTNESGLAEVNLISSIVPGQTKVIARYGLLMQDTTIIFLASEPTNLNVTVTPPVIPADGQTVSLITALITDFDNNPIHSGIPVRFTKVSGPEISFSNIATTDINGSASIQLKALGIGTASIAIEVAGLLDTVEVECVKGSANQLIITSNKTSMQANGIENATITAKVLDANGYPLEGKTVQFSASLGDITLNVPTNANGEATAQFSSSIVGTATITAMVTGSKDNVITASLIIKLLAGGPATINLQFAPNEIGVRNTGQNQTANVYANVYDSKNNIVDDGTLVQFTIVGEPIRDPERIPEDTLYVSLSSYDPIPTVAGVARISCSSGVRSGNVRIRAEVLQSDSTSFNPKIQATSTELIIHAGPPYIEDILQPHTTHIQIVANPLNIWYGQAFSELSILVGDKYNNPVDAGTAIYLTSSGGVITTKSFTNSHGLVQDTIYAGNPFPSVNRWYNYPGMQDPNTGMVLSDLVLPDFERSIVDNSFDNGPGDFIQNNGIAKIMVYANGVDKNGTPAKAWDVNAVVFSTEIDSFGTNSHIIFDNSVDSTANILYYLGPGKTIEIQLWDRHGNPIASGSRINASVEPEAIQAGLSWTEWETGDDMGIARYPLTISNAIDPLDPKPGWAQVKISVESPNGDANIWTTSFFISPDTAP